jgi:hypothetical protein
MADNLFHLKDCSLAAIATGIKARSLIELRDKLADIPLSSIYFHFWGGRLRTAFEHREYLNDFSAWVHYHLHDDILAERLALLNPQEYPDMEELRSDLIELIDDRLDEREFIPWSKSEEEFHFIRSQIVIFDTRHLIAEPRDLIHIIPLLSSSSLFYHFIDAAKRTPDGIDDFSVWLEGFEGKYQQLIEAISKIDPYLIQLSDLQKKLETIFTNYFLEKEHGHGS